MHAGTVTASMRCSAIAALAFTVAATPAMAQWPKREIAVEDAAALLLLKQKATQVATGASELDGQCSSTFATASVMVTHQLQGLSQLARIAYVTQNPIDNETVVTVLRDELGISRTTYTNASKLMDLFGTYCTTPSAVSANLAMRAVLDEMNSLTGRLAAKVAVP